MLTHLLFDIGGTWIKCAAFESGEYAGFLARPASLSGRVLRAASPPDPKEFLATLLNLGAECAGGRAISSAVLSTAGIVHPSGTRLTACAEHLAFLRDSPWLGGLESALGCPARLINDAEAFLLGAAERGYVPRAGTLCCLVIGTGLGCAVSKDARHWRPQRRPSLLGSIRCAGESFDSLASASRLAGNEPGNDLSACLANPAFSAARDVYFSRLSDILITAAILHDADVLLIGGGLVDAAGAADFDLRTAIRHHWKQAPPELNRWPELVVAVEGNTLPLIGAAALAIASEHTDSQPALGSAYHSLTTEQVHPAAKDLHARTPREIIEILWQAETEAGEALDTSLDSLSLLADHIISQWPSGGRLIYVGAGSSGRIAALDAVEIPCTFGCSPDRVVAVVAGGLNEAGLSIEDGGEEDHSGAPDLILLQPLPRDTVVGISASGSSVFVRTALHLARQRGAKTALLRASEPEVPDPWDWTISLASGIEIVAGSTRMKAGTATKKLLNFLTTTVMARTGKLRGPHMIDMACLNSKLADRARRILRNLFPLSDAEASELLAQNNFQLRKAIEAAERQ